MTNLENARTTKTAVGRRDFLTLAWKGLLGLSGLLGLGGLWRFLSYQPAPMPPTAFDLGPAAQFTVGSRAEVAQAQAVVLRGEQGFVAYSLVCPHLGCIVGLEENGFACPCHGSRFNRDGSVAHGPADQPLRALRVEETLDGKIILHTD